MNPQAPKPRRAILFFTCSPKNEARRKPLSARLTFNERVELYEAFTRHVLRQAEAAEYPVLIATDEPAYDFRRHAGNIVGVVPQRGDSFGHRLARAIDDAFAQGFEEIVCVGNDCLELTVANLHAAFEQLAESSLVLGAARDGGVYLIGVRRRVLEPALRVLSTCHWQTNFALADVLGAACAAAISTQVLAPRADIDTVGDVIAASMRLPQLAFLRRVAGILAHASRRFYPEIPSFQSSLHDDRLRYQKAPPAAL